MNNTKKDHTVLIVGLALVMSIVFMGLVFPANLSTWGSATMAYLSGSFGWLYNLSMLSFVLFSIWLALSKYGQVRLGDDDDKPEYSTITWFAMLFSAGMGIGMVFWGVAEPLTHYLNPIEGIDGSTAESAQFAMRKSFLHFGLHPWAGYSVLGLTLAYLQFRKKKSGQISNLLIPFLGEKGANGAVGKLINILALFATVGGIATSLGLGTQQINGGLNYVFGVPDTPMVKIILISFITLVVIASTISGMKKGVMYLSNLNIAIAVGIMALCFFVGPTVTILNTFTNTLGNYIQYWFQDSLAIGDFNDVPWYASWTTFYWAWWIAWAPFVGPFIARISKGRTIREFVVVVLLVPSLASFLWFSIFGSMGITLGADVAAEALKSTATAMFVVLGHYPLGNLISIFTIFVLFTFFITSANSATYVLSMVSSNGNMEPSTSMKVTWAVMQSALALVLMLGSANGLVLLQTIAIVAAFPFIFVMFLSMACLVKFLREENLEVKSKSLLSKRVLETDLNLRMNEMKK